MNLSGPLFVIGVPVLISVVLQLLRRWTVVIAWIAAVTSAVIALVTWTGYPVEILSIGLFKITISEPLVVLGRSLVIDSVDVLPIVFIYVTAAAMFIIAWRLLPHSNFFPVGLLMCGLLSAALMAEQVVYAALLVVMAAVLGVFPLHEPVLLRDGVRYGGTTRGGLQYMSYAALALPGLMITQLLLEQYAVFPGDLSLLQSSTVLLGFSFAILLGAIPFQSWLSTVASDGSPPVVTFLFTVNLGTVWFLLLAYLESYYWLGEQALFGPLFTVIGLLMMVMGGVLAASQRHLGRIVGYATLVDNGAMFVALGTRSTAGLALTVLILLSRPVALGLMTVGLDGLRRIGKGDDSISALAGAAWIAPWRTLAFVVGGIALAGFPASLGFTARWGLYRTVVLQNPSQAVLALSGGAGVMLGLITAIRGLLTRDHQSQISTSKTYSEDPAVLFLIIVLLITSISLGFFPQSLSSIALQMAQGFTFFTN
jgi:formate hydrogenlyase subunit 3/multisubunit Na+/H+ antiporter MnhD subunit